MSQSADKSLNKSLPKAVTKASNKRKRSPTIPNKAPQQSPISRKKLKTSTITNPRSRSQTPINHKSHSNGSKNKSNGNIHSKSHLMLRPSNNHTNTNSAQKMQSKIASITKQKKQLMDTTHSIASSFKGMWKSRQVPQHLLPTTNDTNRGVKRRASGPPTQPQPAAKRQKIAPIGPLKHQKAKSKTTRDEPPPLVTLNEVKWDNVQSLSDYCLGIKPTANCMKKEGFQLNPYQPHVLYETALSNIANDEAKAGVFKNDDLNSMIHQHKVLRHKLKRLRDDLGSHIEKQIEPRRPESPWDCLLDEVTHIAANMRTNKRQKRLKCKMLSTAIRHSFDKKLNRANVDKYQDKSRQIDDQISPQFTITIKNAGNKVFQRTPNIDIAKMMKQHWNDTFKVWDGLKKGAIASLCPPIVPLTVLDGLINLKLDGNNLVDPSWLENIKQDYGIETVNTNGTKVSEIKRAILLKCRGKLSSESTVSECKPIKIRGGRFKSKLRDYQLVGLNWLISLYQNKTNGILSDEVGSGKTAQIIALLAWLSSDQKINGPHLIIVPGAKVIRWENQFRTHYPQCKVLSFNAPMMLDYKAKNNKWNACIVSYDMMLRHSLQFLKIQWQYMVLDEAEKVQDFSSQKWCSLFKLSVQFRLLLVDDDISNCMQLWSMLFCLAPNAFQSKEEFEIWVDNALLNENNNGRRNNILDKLRQVLSPFILRRKKVEMKSLPQIIERQYICHLTPIQQRLYDSYIEANGESSWKAIYELQQICDHPNLYQRCVGNDQLSQYDPISQIHFVCNSPEIRGNIKVIPPNASNAEKKRIEMLYKPLFDKVRDAVAKISKDERASKMDESEDSEDTQDDADQLCVRMKNPKSPSTALREALSMPLKYVMEQKSKIEKDESLPLDKELYCNGLSHFCAKGLCQWDCSKLNALAEILEELHSARRHRVLLFTSNERMLDILELFVLVYQYQYVRCNHGVSNELSMKLMHKFENDRDMFVFLMSTRNIHCCQWDQTKADTVVFYDHEWDSVVQENVDKCVKSINGSHQVTIYRLINENTIEHEIFNHFESDLSKLSVARFYSNNHNISTHSFNDIIGSIEAAANRKSLKVFYDAYNKYSNEFLEDTDVESKQYIEFVTKQLLIKDPNNKYKAKLLRLIGFQRFTNTTFINHQYKMIKDQFIYSKKCYIDCLQHFNTVNKNRRNFEFQSDGMQVRTYRARKSLIDFTDSRKENKDNDDDEVQILETKSKSNKMELDDDEDDDIVIIDPVHHKEMDKKHNKAGVTLSSEIRDSLYMFDQNGDYYHHLYEPHTPFGIMINNVNVDAHVTDAINQSLLETNNPNHWNMYLNYDYNNIIQNEKENDNPQDGKEEEKDVISTQNDSESTIEQMKALFIQWKDANNKMYKQKGVIPGYLDEHNHIQTNSIDPKTKEIIYGTLDDFVRSIGDDHIYRLYQREKQQQNKEESVSSDIPAPITPSHSAPTNASSIKPKRIKLALKNKKPLELCDDLFYSGNNVLSKLSDEEFIIRSPDCELPHKVYDDGGRITAFDFEIYKIKQEWKSGSSKNLKQIIDDFKFTPKPQVIHTFRDSPSPSPAHDHESYRLSDAEDTSDSEDSDKDSVSNTSDSEETVLSSPSSLPQSLYTYNIPLMSLVAKQDRKKKKKSQKKHKHKKKNKKKKHKKHNKQQRNTQNNDKLINKNNNNNHKYYQVHASSSSSSPMPSTDKMHLESSPSSSVNINTVSPNTQRKALLDSLRVPHSRKNTNYSNLNLDKTKGMIPTDGRITLHNIQHWIGLRNDGTLPPQSTPLKPFKIEPKKDPKTGATRYDPKNHPTIFSSKEISELHHIVNSFAAKTKGRRKISWRMVKQTLKTKQNINMRCRTRFELLRVYSKTSKQCKRKDFDSLSYFGMSETLNINHKKQKKSKRTAFWDARFTELQEKKGRGNKKPFKEPLDFDDKKLNAMTKKMTKRMVKELDVCISRVVDLTPDNQNKDEHASHQQTIKSAYQKLNLIVQGQKPYAPNYIWKNHWGQLPVNPYTKPNITHQQQSSMHPSSMNPPPQSISRIPHHGLVHPPIPHPSATSTPHSYMATHPNPNIPPTHRAGYHAGYYSMRSHPHHLSTLHPPHIPPPSGAHPPTLPPHPGTHPLPPYHHGPPGSHPHPSMRSRYSMPSYPSYPSSYPPHPNATTPSRPPGPTTPSTPYPTRVPPHSYHPPYPYMSSSAMGALQRTPNIHGSAPPNAPRPRYPTPMGAATAAPQQHPSYNTNRNTPNTNTQPPNRQSANSNANSRQQQSNTAPPRSTASSSTNNMTNNTNNNANPNFRRAPTSYTSSQRVPASLAGSGGASYNAQQRHMIRQQQQRQYAQQQRTNNSNSNTASNNTNSVNQAPNNSTVNNKNSNVSAQQYRNSRNGASNINNNANNSVPTRNLSQPPRLEQHTTSNRATIRSNNNGMNPNNAKNQFMNSPRPSLPGTINHDNNSNNRNTSSSKPLATLHSTSLFKSNRSKQYMNGNKKQITKQHSNNSQQNPFGSPNTNKNTPANTLGLPSINGNTSNTNNHPNDDAEHEARNGFVSMPSMGSVPITTTINQSMNTSAFNDYYNPTNTAVQSNQPPCPISNNTPSHSRSPQQHNISSPSMDPMLTRNFHRHRTNHDKARKHTVVTNGNGRSPIKPSNLPRSNANNVGQTSSPLAAPTVISTASSTHTDNSMNGNSNNRGYYSHPSHMMNGHSVRQRNQQFVNNNNQYTQQRQPQSYRGMQSFRQSNNVNNMNRGYK